MTNTIPTLEEMERRMLGNDNGPIYDDSPFDLLKRGKKATMAPTTKRKKPPPKKETTPPVAQPDQFLYMFCPKGSKAGPIKIGTSNNVRSEKQHLQLNRESELRCLSAVHCKGGNAAQLAQSLYEKFAGNELRNKWFKINNTDALEAVQELTKVGNYETVTEAKAKLPKQKKTKDVAQTG